MNQIEEPGAPVIQGLARFVDLQPTWDYEMLPRRPEMQRLTRPIFVVGSPRSGTTLLGKVLGAHPLGAEGGESLFLLDTKEMFDSHGLGRNKRGIAWLENFRSPDELLSIFGAMADATLGGILERTGASRLVDHTPWYARISDFVHLLYPDAQWVHIVRDPGSVIGSLTTSHKEGCKWAGATDEARLNLWAQSVTAARSIEDHVPEGNYLEIEYNALISHPATTVRRLCRDLNLPFTASMLKPMNERHAQHYDTTLPVTPASEFVIAPELQAMATTGPHVLTTHSAQR